MALARLEHEREPFAVRTRPVPHLPENVSPLRCSHPCRPALVVGQRGPDDIVPRCRVEVSRLVHHHAIEVDAAQALVGFARVESDRRLVAEGDREIGLVDHHPGDLAGELDKVFPSDVLRLLAGRSHISVAERWSAALVRERLRDEVLDAHERLPGAAVQHHHRPAFLAVQVARELRSRDDVDVNGHRCGC